MKMRQQRKALPPHPDDVLLAALNARHEVITGAEARFDCVSFYDYEERRAMEAAIRAADEIRGEGKK